MLAAPDVAFYQMPEEMFSEITQNPVKAAEIMKQHIIPGKKPPQLTFSNL